MFNLSVKKIFKPFTITIKVHIFIYFLHNSILALASGLFMLLMCINDERTREEEDIEHKNVKMSRHKSKLNFISST